MKRHWLLLLTLFFLIATFAAERISARAAQALVTHRKELNAQIKVASERTQNKAKELKEYAEIQALSNEIAGQVCFEPDSARVLQWFSSTASEVQVALIKNSILPPDAAGVIVAAGAFQRQRFELTLQGDYRPLAQYVERVERSPQPMIIETFALNTDRAPSGSSVGQLKLTISCLTPTGSAETADKKGATP